ncbi:MAG: hypothetical protein ACK5Q5_11920 [Planctomycetaceae bacterium]
MTLDVYDSSANTAEFGRPHGGGRGDGAFPQLHKVSLVELGTHGEVGFAVGSCQDGEQALARQLWDRIPRDALLMCDRNLFNDTSRGHQ